MKRVAIFGNAGGGKSTLAKKLADITGLPLHPIDSIKYRPGGGEVPHVEYLEIHAGLLRNERWIIDGFGCAASAWQRFSAADTLIYVDMPLLRHYAWVTKRLLKGLFMTPEGWPANSPIWEGSLSGYRVIPLCHKHMTPKYRLLVKEQASLKQVHHLKSPAEMRAFLSRVSRGPAADHDSSAGAV
ncbi:adenylate kinase [Nitrospira sp. BLG_2]|uniref:adenylate kinase n=1 Tax=Nitrospira sp. BLG_2 TaxID=3397507 RepID=UPI003B9BA80B